MQSSVAEPRTDRAALTSGLSSRNSISTIDNNNAGALQYSAHGQRIRPDPARQDHSAHLGIPSAIAVVPSGVVTPLACNKDVARFFTLPIELRDHIYDSCYQEQQQQKYEYRGRILYNIRVPIPELRLVNQQVKADYDKRWPLNSTLDFSVIRYDPGLERFVPFPRLPRFAAMSTVVSVDLKFYRGISSKYDLPQHLNVLRFITPALPNLVEDLPHLERLDVSMYFEYQICSWVEKVIRSFEKVDAMFNDVKADYPQLAKVVRLSAVWSELDGAEDVRLATWTPKDGLDYDKEALEARLKFCSYYARCTWEGHKSSDGRA